MGSGRDWDGLGQDIKIESVRANGKGTLYTSALGLVSTQGGKGCERCSLAGMCRVWGLFQVKNGKWQA